MKALAPHARLRAWGAGALIALALGYSPGALAQWNSNKSIVLSQTSGTQVTGSAGPSKLWSDVIGRTIEVNGGTGYVKLKEPGAANMGPGPRVGSTIPVAVSRGVPWSALTRTAAKSLPLISTALAIKELMDAIRCREGAGGGGAGECDAGTSTTTVSATCYRNGAPAPSAAPACLSSYAAAAAVDGPWQVALMDVADPSETYVNTSTSCTGTGGSTVCRAYYSRYTYPGGAFLGAGYSFVVTASPVTASVTKCPDIVKAGVTITPDPGPDGKCETNVYTPADEDTITTKGTNYGNKAKGALIAADLIAAGKPVPHDPPEYDAPASQTGTRETTTAPDGTTTVKDWDWVITDVPDGYTWAPRKVEKTYPPGATIPPQGTIPDGTTTTGAPPSEEKITCGLPGTPPCKIDESGTPTAPADDSAAKVTGLMSGLLACIATPSSCIPALPDMNWSFALPTSCAPIPLPGFGAWIDSIDICPWQPTIHDIMGVVWALTGLFGAVSIIFRGSE